MRQDERFREKYLPEAMSGRDPRVLYEEALLAEGRNNMEEEVPETDHESLFQYGVLQGKPFMLTSVEDRFHIQLQFLTTFSKIDSWLWVPEDFGRQVGNLTGILVATCDFNWSQEHFL